MKIYLIGPWSGLPNLNKAAFDDVQQKLQSIGYSVVNPFDLFENADVASMKHTEYMRTRIKGLIECDSFVLLEGHERSTDASSERIVAQNIGLSQMRLADLLSKSQPKNEPAPAQPIPSEPTAATADVTEQSGASSEG